MYALAVSCEYSYRGSVTRCVSMLQVVAESLDAAIEVATDSRLNATGKFFGAGLLKSHFKGVSPAPIDVRHSAHPFRVESYIMCSEAYGLFCS